MKKIITFLTLLLLTFPQVSLAISNLKLATVYNQLTGEKKVVIIGDKHAFDGGYKLWTKNIGSSVVTDYGPRLSSSITSTQSTIPVTSLSTKDGHTLNMTDFGPQLFLTIEPGASKEEIVMCTAISTSTLSFTGCTRGLSFYGTSTSAVSSNKQSHQSGSSVILSNVHYVYEQYVDRDRNQTVGGIKTFTSPLIYDSSITNSSFTDGQQLIDKSYADFLTGTSSYWLPTGSNIYNANSGKVGIGTGTTTPGSLLQVGKNAATSTPSQLFLGEYYDNAASGSAQIIGNWNTAGFWGIGPNSGAASNTVRIGNILGLGSGYQWSSGSQSSFNLNIASSTFGNNINVFGTTTLSTTTINGVDMVFGTSSNNILRLDSSSKIPAVDGSQLTGFNIYNGIFLKSGSEESNTGTTTITHSLGRTPKVISVSCTDRNETFFGSYNGSSYAYNYSYTTTDENAGTDRILLFGNSSNNLSGYVNTFSTSTVSIYWIKTGSGPGATVATCSYLIW